MQRLWIKDLPYLRKRLLCVFAMKCVMDRADLLYDMRFLSLTSVRLFGLICSCHTHTHGFMCVCVSSGSLEVSLGDCQIKLFI